MTFVTSPQAENRFNSRVDLTKRHLRRYLLYFRRSILLLRRLSYFLLYLLVCHWQTAQGQCANPIQSFPYIETFEANPGGFVAGGNAPDWVWGTPAKTTINRAGEGQRCWITGGLNTATYNGGQASWLQSPCFDFSSLPFPQIRFKVFWETERQFDGAALQYSTDNGASWATAGAASEAPDCLNYNWYNTPAVNFLNAFGPARDGWAGNAQATVGSCLGGSGSGAWVEAARTLPELGGRPAVIFRFVFGSGTQCNTFDGFAVDSIVISAVPPAPVTFEYGCSATPNTVTFQPIADGCPESFSWNFGDPASGAQNASTAETPSHTFSAPGTYVVQLTVTGRGRPPSTVALPVVILNPQLSIAQPISCAGASTGVLQVSSVTGGTAPYSYVWSTNPAVNQPTLANLGAGTYSVTVSGSDACPGTASISLTAPAPLQTGSQVVQPGCGQSFGTIMAAPLGGTGPYSYTWIPAVSTSAMATNLANGSYQLTVTDSRGCVATQTIAIAPVTPPVISVGTVTPVACFGTAAGTATVSVSGGTPPYAYRWNTSPAQFSATATNLIAGTYIATVRDASGCEQSVSVTITQPFQPLVSTPPLVQNPRCGERNGRIIFAADGGTAPYTYWWNGRVLGSPDSSGLPVGQYTMQITDANGCRVQAAPITLFQDGAPATPNLGKDTTLCSRFGLVLNPGRYANYTWSTGSTDSTITVLQSGIYSVTVTTAAGCIGTDSIRVTLETDCGEVYFPSAFSPNGDGKNESFGPLGDLGVLMNYRLQIFNRYGQVVYSSNNPLQQWDGVFQGKRQDSQAFTWMASFRYRGRQARVLRGTILLLR